MSDAGKYNHRVDVLHFDGTQDDCGGYLFEDPQHWTKILTGRNAAIDPLVGKEFYQAQQAQSEITHKIRTRFTSAIKAGDRVAWNGHTFHVEAAIDWQMRGEELLLMCREVV